MAKIDASVKSYYENQKLDADQLERLISYEQLPEPPAQKFSWAVFSTIAASLALTITLILSGILQTPLAESIAKEIAMNHNKQMAVEFNGADFAALGPQMAQLDFQLTRPKDLLPAGLELLGSRYCSIQGQIAAQVKLKDKQGKIYTLYQTQLSDDLEAVQQKQLESQGVQIELWREGNSVYGFAQ